MDLEEQKLRNSPRDLFAPANPFETHIGHFWGVFSTRDYMRARYGLVAALMKLKTYDATETAADHLRDIFRLC